MLLALAALCAARIAVTVHDAIAGSFVNAGHDANRGNGHDRIGVSNAHGYAGPGADRGR